MPDALRAALLALAVSSLVARRIGAAWVTRHAEGEWEVVGRDGKGRRGTLDETIARMEGNHDA